MFEIVLTEMDDPLDSLDAEITVSQPVSFNWIIPLAVLLIVIAIILIIIFKRRSQKRVHAFKGDMPAYTKVNYCINCGSPVNESDKYCGKCGKTPR
jgi:hypothetical protein